MADGGDEDVEGQLGLGVALRPPLPRYRAGRTRRRSSPSRPDYWPGCRAPRRGLAGLAEDDRQGEDVEVADAVIMRQARLRAHAQAARDRLAVADRHRAMSFRPGGTRSL